MNTSLHARTALPSSAESLDPRLIDSSPDCIKVLDLDGRLLSMNANGVRLLEICDLADVVGSQWIEFWTGDDRTKADAAVQAARSGSIGRFVGYFPTRQSHTPKWWDVVISPILDANGKPERLLASSRDVTEWKRADNLLHAIIDGTSAVAGEAFFESLVQHLARGMGVRWVFVAECLPNHRARALAFYRDRSLAAPFEYNLPGTPCMEVTKGRICHVPDHLAEAFPEDKGMINMGTVSYLGVPLREPGGRVIGHLVAFDDKPMPHDPLAISVLETFANRAAVELERMHAFKLLERRNEESEERYRDLFEEAPIAYVHEGLDTRFVRANRAAMRILGIRPDEIEGTYGKTFIPDTPDAQRRLREALESIGRGTDTSGVVLELRRRDNGEPVWIQWWSRPDPSGKYTRTMFIDITERVLMEREKTRLEAQNSYLQEEIRTEHNFGEIVGHSRALLEILKSIDQIAPTDATVLICGETGTGKELVARAVHDRSTRAARPLVKVNCAAISAGLVESELFGHVKGAFTGALTNRDGRFKLADGGTLFLDEVGELSLDTQAKLLRVLQEQEFEPVGSGETVRVDVRIIAATNRNLGAAVKEGRFRNDLFYRLNVVPLKIPSLRERTGDVPLLVTFFLERFAKRFGKPIKHVSDEIMCRLMNYAWPGNIRELQNVIERAVVLSPGNTLVLGADFGGAPDSTSLPEAEQRTSPASSPAPVTIGSLEDAEKRHIEAALKNANWMIEGERGAARILNVNPSTLRSRMQKLGIRRKA